MENFVTKISFLVYFEKTWLHHGLMSGRTDIYSMISFFLIGNKAKGRISKRVFQKSKAHQIFRKTNISYPLIRTRTCTYQGVRNLRYSEHLVCFVFLKHLFWDSPSCLITVFCPFFLYIKLSIYQVRYKNGWKCW